MEAVELMTIQSSSNTLDRIAARFMRLASIYLVLGFVPCAVKGGIVHQLGEQDFFDGQNPVSPSDAAIAGAGEPFPFDGTFFGDDRFDGQFGSFSYTHDFTLGSLIPTAATLTIGLHDHDSFSGNPPRDTIDLFFDGIQQPDDMFLGISFEPASVSVVEVPVPIALLLDGMLTVQVSATARASAFLPGNGISADFSRLNIVPEPTTIILVALGVLAGIRRPRWSSDLSSS